MLTVTCRPADLRCLCSHLLLIPVTGVERCVRSQIFCVRQLGLRLMSAGTFGAPLGVFSHAAVRTCVGHCVGLSCTQLLSVSQGRLFPVPQRNDHPAWHLQGKVRLFQRRRHHGGPRESTCPQSKGQRQMSVEDKSPVCLTQERQQESDPVYTHRRPTGRRQSSCLQPSLSVWPQISFCVWGWGVWVWVWAGLQLPLWSLSASEPQPRQQVEHLFQRQ